MTEDIFLILTGLAGLGGFISILVNILKIPNIVKDGDGERWTTILNFIAFIAVSVVYFIKVPIDWQQVNEYLLFGTALLGFVLQIWTSSKTYEKLRGTPVIGYSHTLTNGK